MLPAPAVRSAAGCLTAALVPGRYPSLMKTISIPGPAQAWTRRLLRCGVAAGPVFITVFLLEGAVRDGYQPLRHPVSSLALGSRGWIQAGNFALAGTLFLRTGAAHTMAAVPVFFGLPAAALACGWRSLRAGQRGFGLYSAATAITMLATMALASAGFGQSPRLAHLGGLFQRAGIITGFGWLSAVSARALRHAPPATAPNQ